MVRKIWGGIFLYIGLILLSACTFHELQGSPEDINRMNQTNTAAVATVVEIRTRVATLRTPTPYGMSTATLTPHAVYKTKEPTATFTPSPTIVPPPADAPCNKVEFIADETIPDGSAIPPRTTFVKIWKLRNAGSCVWNYRYSLVFADRGDRMNAPKSKPLSTRDIKPGEVVSVSVQLLAPEALGNYESHWRLRAGDGTDFGVDAGGGTLFTRIRVEEEYSFVDHLCSAQWSTGPNNPLPCPGSASNTSGFVSRENNPQLEDGQYRTGPGLITAPVPAAGGVIIGKYPPIVVPKDAQFHSLFSCQPGENGCFVHIKITYRAENGEEKTLEEWDEGLEGAISTAAEELDEIEGRPVAFTFYVSVTGNPAHSRGVWFNPRISK